VFGTSGDQFTLKPELPAQFARAGFLRDKAVGSPFQKKSIPCRRFDRAAKVAGGFQEVDVKRGIGSAAFFTEAVGSGKTGNPSANNDDADD
jgi:hypothetical protein